ncbi:GIY-YIG nuclease family protein [Streptomyces asoensis]|uniref:GIY-YIG nuclease family protein n=1 Tax=Streptomyces asoensis TaxID=249586 RepID=UPI0033D678AE
MCCGDAPYGGAGPGAQGLGNVSGPRRRARALCRHSSPIHGEPDRRQNLRKRVRYHYRGNAAGSTLRFTLGCLLGLELRPARP